MPKPLLLHGKCRSQPTVAAGTSDSENNLHYLIDKRSGITFLVDTGATLSVFPATFADITIMQRSPTTLSAANGSAIPTYGKKRINCSGYRRALLRGLVIRRRKTPALGDYLFHHAFLHLGKNTEFFLLKFIAAKLVTTTFIAP